MQRHVLAGLAAVLLILFSHCWVLLYLLGTGRAMRDAIRQFGLAPDLLEQAGRSLKAVTPGLLAAMGLVMATFAVGGAVASGSLPRWSHHTLFYATLAVQLWTLWQENRVLAGNEALMAEVGRRIGDREAAAESQAHA
jgi:hypothetical protein